MPLIKVKYQIESLKSAKDDLELSIIKKIIELSEDIKKGRTEPKELGIIYLLRARFKNVPARLTKKIRAIKEDTILEATNRGCYFQFP